MEEVTRKAPGRSKPPDAPGSRATRFGSGSRSGRQRASAASPTGLVTKKIQGHPKVCVSAPPSRTPTEAPPETTKAQTPIALALDSGSLKVVIMIERAAGAMIAPPTPCKARAATSNPCEPETPHKSEANVNKPSPKANTLL